MTHIRSHGGGCCGMNHIMGFGTIYKNPRTLYEKRITKTAVDTFKTSMRNFTGRNGNNLCVEAALTDGQMESGWDKVLHDFGFKHVHRFRNPNSGNYVNVLLYNKVARCRKPRPFKWGTEEAEPQSASGE